MMCRQALSTLVDVQDHIRIRRHWLAHRSAEHSGRAAPPRAQRRKQTNALEKPVDFY